MTDDTRQRSSATTANLASLEQTEARAWRCAFPGRDLGGFHLARVGGRLCLFHRGGLAVSEPEAWSALLVIARRLDAALMVDRRERLTAVANDRRRAALALTVAAGLFTRSALAGDAGAGQRIESPRPVAVALAPEATADALSLPAVREAERERRLMRDDVGRLYIGRARLAAARRVVQGVGLIECNTNASAPSSPCLDAAVDHDATSRIEALLLQRLARPVAASMRATLTDVAHYYARHPEVVRLFDVLATHPWTLEPRDGTWLTQAKVQGGSVLGIRVLFDFKAAAQMHFAGGCSGQPACTAMPADAFLHELLHVYVIHAAPGRFSQAATGGVYPHAHEAEVIALENRLYRAMEARDGLPRPARDTHAGRLTEVDCPLCWASRADLEREPDKTF
ncbi:MAG TPA: hypothetical protein DCY89_07995 [Gammaproteobacteria bacterium]|nr:hypothetical protein [Gammaproteobacteria bacterium]